MDIPSRSQFKSKQAGGQSRKFIENRRRRFIISAFLGAVAVISWVFAISRLTFLAIFNIQEVHISGADSDIRDMLSAAAMQAMDGNYLGLFSKSSSLIYPQIDVGKALLNADARINNVTVSRSGLQSLNITVEEKKPAAVVCTDLPDWDGSVLVHDSSDSCYLVDNAGYAFMNASSTDFGLNLFYMPEDESGSSISNKPVVGTMIASTTMFRDLQTFYNGAHSYGIPVKAILVKGGGEYEMYVDAGSGIVIVYFNEINGFDNELSALISFWNDINQKSKSKNGKIELDSIDLRYGSNIFYRIVR